MSAGSQSYNLFNRPAVRAYSATMIPLFSQALRRSSSAAICFDEWPVT
jgi:hypothetical protein